MLQVILIFSNIFNKSLTYFLVFFVLLLFINYQLLQKYDISLRIKKSIIEQTTYHS